ncbi:MAG: hypothetical protein ABIU05_16905 [Nitrospirales bacterium]
MLAHVKIYIDWSEWARYAPPAMGDKSETQKTGTWIVRNIPADLMRRTRMASLAEQKTVRQILIDLVEGHLMELEKKGLLPKGK